VVCDLEVLNLACSKLAPIEEEQHFFFRIAMVGHVEDAGHFDLDAALLTALADDCGFGRLPVFELAARKLPHAGEMLPVGAAREQHAPVSDHHGGCDDGSQGVSPIARRSAALATRIPIAESTTSTWARMSSACACSNVVVLTIPAWSCSRVTR
jgi:hypothetical protein